MDVEGIITSIIVSALTTAGVLATERYRTRLERQSEYRAKQSTSYMDLFRYLTRLKLAADELWQDANVVTLSAFISQLRVARTEVETNALLLEKQHVQELRSLIQEFSNFQVGKERLLDLRSELISSVDLQNVIDGNRQTKQRYDMLIAQVETAFRRQIRTT